MKAHVFVSAGALACALLYARAAVADASSDVSPQGLAGYEQLYQLAVAASANYTSSVPYTVDNSATVGTFDRVAYYLELDDGATREWVWVSMDAFTSDATRLGVPALGAGGFVWQQAVANMDVESNKAGIITGTAITTGNVEFWPYNYTTNTSAGYPGASSSDHDFDDTHTGVADYGSMQIHNYGAAQSIFALNRFHQGDDVDIGIGNRPTGNPDWTFARNGSSYTVRNLEVWVRTDSTVTVPTLSEAGLTVLLAMLALTMMLAWRKRSGTAS